MKRFITIIAAVAMVIGMSASFSFATIVGSPHDFSTASWNFRGEICRVCHVPHDNESSDPLAGSGVSGLLWNHAVDNTTTFTLYGAAGTLNFLQGTIGQPTGISKLCLGCHDGTVALGQFDSNAFGTDTTHAGVDNTTMISDVSGAMMPATPGDLSRTHPISIMYDNLNDSLLHDPNTSVMGSLASGQTYFIKDVLDNGMVQCSSCHDVHNQEVLGAHLLRVDNSTSGLCLTCHIK